MCASGSNNQPMKITEQEDTASMSIIVYSINIGH
jgi:hypothetical protein